MKTPFRCSVTYLGRRRHCSDAPKCYRLVDLLESNPSANLELFEQKFSQKPVNIQH